MTKNAPTTKVSNNVNHDQSLVIEVNNVLIRASYVDMEIGDDEQIIAAHYSIDSFDGGSAYRTRTYSTVQELANAMREIADLRTWRQLYANE